MIKRINNTKSFTLIELLAVIAILAIILLIAVPKIIDVMEVAKRESFRESATLIGHAGEFFQAKNSGDQIFYYHNGAEANADGYALEYSGQTPQDGVVITNDNGKVALALHDGKYCAKKSTNEKVASVSETIAANCVAYDIIQTPTCDSWSTLADKYDVTLEDLLAANGNPAQNSSTCGLDINIPITANSSSESAGIYYKTYYSMGYVLTPSSYDYTIELGVLPLDIADITTASVTAQSVFEPLSDFRNYIVKKNMGEVIWNGEQPQEIDINQATVFHDHAATSSNMEVDGVSIECDTETCYAHIYVAVNNLNNVNLNEVNGNNVAYTPVKFTVMFNGTAACPYTRVPESCFAFSTGTITDYNYTTPTCPHTVTIPKTIGGVAVTAIGNNAFEASNLTCVIIPSNITSVGTSAFRNNTLTGGIVWKANMTAAGSWLYPPFANAVPSSITFGSNVTRIPSNLLRSANFTFNNLTIPSTVTAIGTGAFLYNTNLHSVTVPSSVTSVESEAFANSNLTGGIIWDANITSLDSGSPIFRQSNPASITFGPNVTKVPSNFLRSSNFTFNNLVIPSTITTVGAAAFMANANLQSVSVPSSVTAVGAEAFADSNLTGGLIWNANIASLDNISTVFRNAKPASVTFGSNVNIIPSNFLRSANVTFNDLVIPSTITTIGAASFMANANIHSVTVPSSVTSVGNEVFSNTNLTGGLVWNADITTIGSSASPSFVNAKVASITFGANVTKIPTYFMKSAAMTMTVLDIPSTITTVGGCAFEGNSLTSITVPSSVTSVGDYAFKGNSISGTLTWNANIDSVGRYTFDSTNIGTLVFGANVTKIPTFFLYNATPAFTTLTIPNTITTIKDCAFEGDLLTSITIPSSVTTIGSYALKGNSLTNITIPSSVTSIGSYALQSNSLTSITIGSGTTLGSQLLTSNESFKTTYTAGGAGTYTGTQAGTWTKS